MNASVNFSTLLGTQEIMPSSPPFTCFSRSAFRSLFYACALMQPPCIPAVSTWGPTPDKRHYSISYKPPISEVHLKLCRYPRDIRDLSQRPSAYPSARLMKSSIGASGEVFGIHFARRRAACFNNMSLMIPLSTNATPTEQSCSRANGISRRLGW